MNNWLHIRFWEYDFLAPQFLWLLILIPVIILMVLYRERKSEGHIKFSRAARELSRMRSSWVNFLLFTSKIILILGFVSLVFALAKPFNPDFVDNEEDFGEGIDIMIALDISGSMLATDFEPNRLEAAKELAKEFVDNRKGDRIGLVVYEGEAYTACPATRNHDFLKKTIDDLSNGWLDPGTAIGIGLGTAIARLRADSLKSRVVILLTDGENNKGKISPKEAGKLASEKGIRVYTIGVGKEGYAKTPQQTPFGTIMQQTLVSIDEELLTNIAENSGGKYFRATDNSSLREIYKKIGVMEKTKMVDTNIEKQPPEHPNSFLLMGFICFLFASVVELILYKNVGK